MIKRSVFQIEENWTFRQANDESSPLLPVSQFPTNVHLDLIANGLIPEPFFSSKEDEVQWVGEKSWEYQTSFVGPSKCYEKAVLAFEGLDTYASVELNGRDILKTDNMFIPERVDVTKLLKDGEDNQLTITFQSAFLSGKKVVERYPDHLWGCWNGDPSRLAVRKAQYHYGWDWGPTLLTCGPWRPIALETYSSRIADLSFRTDIDASLKSAEVIAKADIEDRCSSSRVKFGIYLHGGEISSEIVAVNDGHAVATFRTQNPELWYPFGYGKQPIYTLKATLLADNQELDSASKSFGLRSVKLIERELKDASGTSFFFQINNIPIFCGGSNWIPADSFIPRITPQKYRDWVKLALEGNQVMLRVWGGGIFEEEAFYDACDEMGVLVWQDFLFACGNYPTHDEFLDSVYREAKSNVKLLRHHPSIIVWAGNNEDYQYAESTGLDYDPTDGDPGNWLSSSFPARYIYEELLPTVIQELAPDTPYRYGSPWGGKTTTDQSIGDLHQWNVWHGTQEKYQNFSSLSGRFVSEFGMEALPSLRTIHSFLPLDSSDLYSQSLTMDHHNKAAGHERRLATYLTENIRYPFTPLAQYIYSTQLMQAECLSTAYRLWKREWKGPGKEYCAGALLWQLDDCWPGTSWSIVDYYLRPKSAYFAVKRELAHLTVGMKRIVEERARDKYTKAYVQEIHKIELWAVNLGLEKRIVNVILKAWDVVTGNQTLYKNIHEDFILEPNRSTEIDVFELLIRLKGSNERKASDHNEIKTVIAAYLIENGTQVARAVNWFEPLKYVPLQKPKALKMEVASDMKSFLIETDIPVKGLVVECENDEVRFEDNCVDCVPGERVAIGVSGLGREDELTARFLGMEL
ncbi:MAG: hypothetical protein M1812_006397 [Candelaria pacifica]|nr:MAG: hypothetical protein M1812_006397 [Candelaria pacifica]